MYPELIDSQYQCKKDSAIARNVRILNNIGILLINLYFVFQFLFFVRIVNSLHVYEYAKWVIYTRKLQYLDYFIDVTRNRNKFLRKSFVFFLFIYFFKEQQELKVIIFTAISCPKIWDKTFFHERKIYYQLIFEENRY